MSDPQSRPKRNRKPSNRLLRAQGLATNSEDEDDDDFEPAQQSNTDEDNNEHGLASSLAASTPVPPISSMLTLPPAPPTSSMLTFPPAILRTQSTTSIVSQASVLTTTRTDDDRRWAKFDERFQTATSTEEEVLHMSP